MARTLHRSQAWPVRVYDDSLFLTTEEKSSDPRSSLGSLTLGLPARTSSVGLLLLSPPSPGRFRERTGGMVSRLGRDAKAAPTRGGEAASNYDRDSAMCVRLGWPSAADAVTRNETSTAGRVSQKLPGESRAGGFCRCSWGLLDGERCRSLAGRGWRMPLARLPRCLGCWAGKEWKPG